MSVFLVKVTADFTIYYGRAHTIAHKLHIMLGGQPVGISHPLFGFSSLGDAWDIAGITDRFDDDRRDSLATLAANLEKLPAPVFFVVPDGFEGNERWRRAVAASAQYCGCPSRRVLLPAHGRSRFVPATEPRLVDLSMAEGEHEYYSAPLIIAPHGGDAASAYVSWRFEYNRLCSWEWPYREHRPSDAPMLYGCRSARDRPGITYNVQNLQAAVERQGELICSQTVGGGLLVPVCSIVKVAWKPGGGYSPIVTVELDASVAVIEFDPANPPAPHVCVAA